MLQNVDIKKMVKDFIFSDLIQKQLPTLPLLLSTEQLSTTEYLLLSVCLVSGLARVGLACIYTGTFSKDFFSQGAVK